MCLAGRRLRHGVCSDPAYLRQLFRRGCEHVQGVTAHAQFVKRTCLALGPSFAWGHASFAWVCMGQAHFHLRWPAPSKPTPRRRSVGSSGFLNSTLASLRCIGVAHRGIRCGGVMCACCLWIRANMSKQVIQVECQSIQPFIAHPYIELNTWKKVSYLGRKSIAKLN